VTGDVDMLKALLAEARAEVARLTAALAEEKGRAENFKQDCEYRGAVLTEARAAANEQGDYLHDADGDLARAVRMLGGDLRFNIEKRCAAESALTRSEEARREAERTKDVLQRSFVESLKAADAQFRARADAAEARASAAEEALRAVRCLAEDWRAYADKPWADMGEAILTLLAARALSSAPRDAGEGAAP
jgi:chromosome segregation ATPase